MNTLTHSRKFHRFTINAQSPIEKHFRIYDALDRGYVIMTDGKVIGIADTIAQAQAYAQAYAFACENMASHAIPAQWYNEIKNKVPHGDPYYYISPCYNKLAVEVDVNEHFFNIVSTQLGWL
jgi:hypothetical protein